MYFDEKYGKKVKKEGRETLINHVDMWYKCSWIVNSDYCFNYGVQNDIVRPQDNKAECSYKAHKMSGKSRLELIIPNLDNLQLTWLKLQNAIAQAAPAGLAIEIATLQNISMGNQKLHPLEIIKIRNQQGTLLYRTTTHRSYMPTPTTAKPIQELSGGIGNQLTEFMTIMENDLRYIREISGVSAPMDASSPQPDQGLGVTQIAQTAATRSLAGIYTAYIDLKERLARDVAFKIQNLITANKTVYEGYYNSIGKGTTQLLMLDKEVSACKFNFILKARPGEQEKQNIRQAALESMKASKNGYGGISQADYLLIERMLLNGNLKFAEMIFAKKERDAEIRRETLAMQREQQNQKEAQVLQAQKHREKMEADQSEKALKLDVIKAETDKELVVLREKHKFDMERLDKEGESKMMEKILGSEKTAQI